MTFLLFLSEAMVPLMIFYMVGFGLLSGRPVLDDFIRGARDGMKTVAGIFPTLVGLMVSVGVLRSSGLLDALGELLKAPAALVGLPAPILPAALVRLPLRVWFWIFLRNTARSRGLVLWPQS